MANDRRLDIKKVIDQGAQHTTVSNLASMGVRNVKVLDEAALQEMIERAVDLVISTQTAEERTKILADSRKQLSKLMAERDQFGSRANLLEAGKTDLVAQIEKLQNELKLRRQIEEEGESDFKTQLKDIIDRQQATESKLKESLADNVWLREEHDRMVEELDKAQSEIKRLQAEIDRLTRELEALRAKADEQAGASQELDDALQEVDSLRTQLEGEQQKAQDAKQAGDRRAEEEEQRTRAAEQAEAEADVARRAEEEEKTRVEAEAVAARRAEEQAKARAEAEAAAEARRAAEQAETEAAEAIRAEEEAKARAEAEEAARRAEEEEKARGPKRIPIVLLERRKAAAKAGQLLTGKGLDIGTVNLVAAEQNVQGEVELRLARNAFIDVETTAYTKSMLTRLNVPYFMQGSRMYVLGEQAFELANVLNRNTRRPMKDGLISPKETDALPIMKLLIGSILGEPRVTGESCFYSVPGEPVDADLSVAYHRDLFDAVLRALGYTPRHIIEGHAVTFSELADEDFTGIGVSCGGGMFNVCVAYMSMPALTFSTARSGDWIDLNVGQTLNMKPARAALIKEKGVDLMNPRTREEDAIAIYYRNLIQYNLSNIAERFRAAENMPTFADPITMVFSGGTALAGNFIELVRTIFKDLDFPIPVKEVRLAKDPLNATAKGALTAALLEMSQQSA